jgi:hypothetical protein
MKGARHLALAAHARDARSEEKDVEARTLETLGQREGFIGAGAVGVDETGDAGAALRRAEEALGHGERAARWAERVRRRR